MGTKHGLSWLAWNFCFPCNWIGFPVLLLTYLSPQMSGAFGISSAMDDCHRCNVLFIEQDSEWASFRASKYTRDGTDFTVSILLEWCSKSSIRESYSVFHTFAPSKMMLRSGNRGRFLGACTEVMKRAGFGITIHKDSHLLFSFDFAMLQVQRQRTDFLRPVNNLSSSEYPLDKIIK
jgi:hypothetical protein